jgi:F0F1-type ATP synthase assembly protein I
MSKGSDFKAKLQGHQLMAGNFSIDVNKALYNKVIKHHAQGVGMVITLPSVILSKLAKSMDITVPKDLSLVGAGKPKRTPRSINGGAIAMTPAAAMAAIGMVNEFIEDHPAVKNFIAGIAEDIAYLFNNPMAISYRFIVAVKIPNMNKRYRDLIINIERLKKIISSLKNQTQVKRHQRRIINLETLSQKVANHIQTLLERIPYIKEMAEERNETLKERKAEQLKKQIEKTETQLETLKKKDEAEAEGEGLQVMPYGNGLQVDPAPYGNGIVIDKIKGRIKKEITPIIDNEKEKMKKQMEKEIEKAKKKAEAQVKQKFNAEISKQKSNLQNVVPMDISQFTGGCMHCGKKKR